MNLSGRHAILVGFGRSGRASASFIRRAGGLVTVVDRADTLALRSALEQAGVEGRLGGYSEEDLDGVDLVVASPGVSWDAPLLECARRRGIIVTSEMDLFFQACPCPIVGISGTNGKTTTTALVAELLRAGDLPVMRGGNIGEPVLDRLDELTPTHRVVLELSSFQLESIGNPRLSVGVVLNVTADHLDRHGSLERYVDIKARAVQFMGEDGHAVLNFDDPVCVRLASRTRGRVVPFSIRPGTQGMGVSVKNGWIVATGDGPERVLKASDVPLPGGHNLSNVLAAIGTGSAQGVAIPVMAAAIRRFPGVEHRLELVGTWHGVRWYNDSKATNPDSTLMALAAFREPIVLIAGGRNKGIDLDPLARVIAGRVAMLVAIGETGEELVRRVGTYGLARAALVADMAEAVRQARFAARPGDVVLLSPAFASYDMFQDFEDRGRRFKAAVLREAAS